MHLSSWMWKRFFTKQSLQLSLGMESKEQRKICCGVSWKLFKIVCFSIHDKFSYIKQKSTRCYPCRDYAGCNFEFTPVILLRDSEKNETCQHFSCKIWLQVVPIFWICTLCIKKDQLLYQFWLNLSKTFIESCYFYTQMGTISSNNIINWLNTFWI